MAAANHPRVLVDGKAVEVMPVSDRGLHYADGLFETIRMCGDKAPLWSRHMARLDRGAVRLGLPAPDPELLAHECTRVSAGRSTSVCKIIYTRGSGGRAYVAPDNPRPLRVVMSREAPPLARIELAVTFCRTPLAISPALAGLKHCGRLEQVLARRELAGSDFGEGLMCDAAGRVIEATSANLFVLHDDIISTPDLAKAGVAGVMRELVMEILADQGCQVSESTLEKHDCRQARALFLCNAVRGIMPVTRLESKDLEVPQLVEKLSCKVETILSGG